MKSLDDAFIPMEAEDLVKLHYQKRKRDEHWARLRSARLDCPDILQYISWLESQYGLRVHLANEMITDDYTIVDNAKYTMYLLKYSQ